ncbi:MAG: hypothetical protein ACOH5I_22440 [Oligoflexus sp.]
MLSRKPLPNKFRFSRIAKVFKIDATRCEGCVRQAECLIILHALQGWLEAHRLEFEIELLRSHQGYF